MTCTGQTSLGLTLALVLSTAAPVLAADGVLIVQQMTMNGVPMTSQVQMEPNRVRTEIADPNGGTQTVIFDGPRQVLLLVNSARKSYIEMTKADVDRIAAMLAQMQAQMANMPPAARSQMEGMMRGRGMPGSPGAKTEYKKTGSGKTGKWSCDTYDGYQGGQKVSEICTVAPSVVGLNERDFAAARQMAEFFKTLIPQGADQIINIGTPEEQGFSGVPVRTSTTAAGQQITVEIVDVKRDTFSDSIFTVPAGFQKQDFMGMGGRGAR
jgi:metal-dependent amidase/aminoacylase/carboxypeptidase family protein